MSIESDLYAALVVQCPRVYPDVAPAGAVAPYVVYSLIGGRPLAFTDNALPDLRNAEVQVDVWATTRLAANALSLQIEAALIQSAALNARPASGMSNTVDEDTDLYGASMDFTIWGLR